jgi:hypothetical protein
VPSGHHPRQLGVGGRDDAHVDLDRLVAADAFELALLQRAQQPHLQAGTHRAYFVEEQRTFVRLLEPALPGAHRAGERAALVTEDLRFEQRFREWRLQFSATNRCALRGLFMCTARATTSLPVPGFAGDQNRAGRARHCFEQLKQGLHGPAAAEDAAELIALSSCDRR